MIISLIFFLITAGTLVPVSVTMAETVSGPEITQLKSDSSQVNIRLPDPDRMAQYSDDPDFNYDEAEPGESILELLFFELIRWLNRIFGEGTGNTVMQTVFLLLLIAAIVLLVNQILKGNIRNAFYGRSAASSFKVAEGASSEIGADFNRLIEKAIQNKDYREAVRLTYQKALRELNDSGLIRWEADKTNSEYITEVATHPVSEPLQKLTRIYDYTEYGDFGIDSAGYSGVKSLYQTLSSKLKQKNGGDDD